MRTSRHNELSSFLLYLSNLNKEEEEDTDNNIIHAFNEEEEENIKACYIHIF